jgi:hypothetical protein
MVAINDYNEETTVICERALVTLLGDIGPWGSCIYLVGGLTPRYLVEAAAGTLPHVGTSDVDLGIVLAVDDVEAYQTLETNLRKSGFMQRMFPDDPSFRWRRRVGKAIVTVEFLCDADSGFGRMAKVGRGTGSAFQALRVKGVSLVARDYQVRDIERERLDDRGISRVSMRIASLLPFVVLKIQAFQDRHKEKDSYDLVYCLLNHEDGPKGAARCVLASPILREPFTVESLRLLRLRFETEKHDGPIDYARFMAGTAAPEPREALVATTVVQDFCVELVALGLELN